MKIKEIVIAILLVVGLFLAGRWTAPQPEPVIERETVVDTTMVDSLQNQVTYWRDIAETRQDTLGQEDIELPDPEIQETDGTRVYNVPYSDQNLSANIGLTVEGILGQVDFEYILKRELVVEERLTLRETRTITKTTTYQARPPGKRKFGFNHSLEGGYKFSTELTDGVPALQQSPYIQYRPEFRVFGIDLVGTAHLSNNSFLTIGLKKEF